MDGLSACFVWLPDEGSNLGPADKRSENGPSGDNWSHSRPNACIHRSSEVAQASSRSSISRIGLRLEIPAVDRFRDRSDHGNTAVLLQCLVDGYSVPLHAVPVDGNGASGAPAKLVRSAMNDSDTRITALRRTGHKRK